MATGFCPRPIHAAPEGIDAEPVCFMHSKDPAKHTGNPLYSQFFLEFKSILASAGARKADFTRFVFPHLNLRSTAIEAQCIFNEAVFEEHLFLYDVTFEQDVEFLGSAFLQPLDWQLVKCTGTMDLQNVTFSARTNFNYSTFEKEASFFGSTFGNSAIFQKANFLERADFSTVHFNGPTNFSSATFSQTVSLEGSTFVLTALFLDTVFEKVVDFSHVNFEQGATFPRTKFHDDVLFIGTNFAGDSHFLVTQFHKGANFTAAKFLASASFRETRFRSDNELEPGPIFTLTRFCTDANTLFYKTDLSHALFHNCNISDVTFPSVIWRKRPNNQNLMVFEEDLPLDSEHASTLRLPSGERDYGLIAQLYQQLKKNYDDRLDYWAADHFHYGEMEMQRFAVPRSGPLLRLRQFYHRHLSLIAWYRRGSSYGNSYLRPAAWLIGILVLFILLYPVTGLQRTNPNPGTPPLPSLTYRSVWPSLSPLHDKIWAELKLLGKSAFTTIDTASFQKNSEYLPTYPSGRGLAILETLLAATLFALFLLAIRRQFRR
jgi:uncharacterized protein YjbI with pentapeptide repeats